MKMSLLILSWGCFSCLDIQRIGIQFTDHLLWKIIAQNSMFPCYFLLNMKVFWLYMVSAPPLIAMGWLIWKFAKILWWQNFLVHLWQDKRLWVELKIYGGVIFIMTSLHFHYFISVETANTQKKEVFLLRISSWNVNASVVNCRYPQIYNFSFNSLTNCVSSL